MLAIAAAAALIAFSATVEAATLKYDYSGREKYRHDDRGSYKPYYKHGAYESEHEDYSYEPSYASPYADREYKEPRHDEYHYDRDVYFEERSVKDEMGVREDQVLVPFGGKIGKKLGKILHNPVLKKVSKRSADDEDGEDEKDDDDIGEVSDVEEGDREGQQNSCCSCIDRVRVESSRGWDRGNIGPRKYVRFLYQTYTMGSFRVNGHDHWISRDGDYAMWKTGSFWFIGNERGLGGKRGSATIKSSADCVHDTGFEWEYNVPGVEDWVKAKAGLGVRVT